MPRLNSTKGAMQHDEAAIAPRIPPAATSFCVRLASSGAAGVRVGSQRDLVEESFMNTASLIDINLCYILHRKRVGQKKREYSSSSVAGESWGSLSIKSAPCLLLAGRERRHAPRCGRSLNITSKTFPQRLTILLGLNACCVRRSRNALAGRHQIAPCWIFWMSKAPGLPAHSAVRAQARLS